MDLTYAMILLIAGGILAALAVLVVKKKDTRKMMGWIGAILLVPGLIAVASPGTIGFLDQTFSLGPLAAGDVGEEPAFVSGELCAVEDTTITLSATDQFTSAATGGTHRYNINGAPALTVSNAGTFTASPGDRLSILWFNASAGYFSAVDEVVIPCAGTRTFSTELIKNGTITMDIFNEEGNKVTVDTINETLSAGDVVTLEAKLKGQFERGMPYGGVIVCEYNRTAYDDCIVDFGGEAVNLPALYTFGATRKAKAYSVPAVIGTEILYGSVTIDADDTADPNGPSTDTALNMTFYPKNYFVNEEKGGISDGPAVEDEDEAATVAYNIMSPIPVD